MIATADGPSVHNSSVESIADMCGDWFAAQVKSRQEAAFARECENGVDGDPDRRISYFLPLVRQRRIHGGKKRIVDIPLFAGYVFCCGDGQARYEAMATGRICQVVKAPSPTRLRAELIDLERVIASSYTIDLYSFAVVGRRVRVRSGPLQGVLGTVTERDGTTRIVMEVSMLNVGAELTIDADLLEPAD